MSTRGNNAFTKLALQQTEEDGRRVLAAVAYLPA